MLNHVVATRLGTAANIYSLVERNVSPTECCSFYGRKDKLDFESCMKYFLWNYFFIYKFFELHLKRNLCLCLV